MIDLLTGLRIGAMIHWTWVAARVVFETWGIHTGPEADRARGWKYWRASLLVMSVIVVCFFSPENILRANGFITEETGFMMLVAGVAGLHVAAWLNLAGLDVATGRSSRALPAYILISVMSVLYGMARAGL